MLNLRRDKMREPGRNGKILSERRQHSNVAVGEIGNLLRRSRCVLIFL